MAWWVFILGIRLGGGFPADQQGHAVPLTRERGFNNDVALELRQEFLEDSFGIVAVGVFPAAEDHFDFDFVAFLKEFLGNRDAVVQVVVADFEGQAHAFDFDFLLVRFLFALSFFNAVLVRAVVEQFADRRFGVRGYLDQIKAAFTGQGQCAVNC